MSPVARFVVMDGPDVGQEHLVADGQATLGRSLQCDIVLADELASRQHARVSYENGDWIIKDLNSRNGTFVNEQAIQPHVPHLLFSGDRVRLASTVLAFYALYDEAGMAPIDEPGYSDAAAGPADGALHPLIFAMIGVTAVLLLVLGVLAALVVISP